jgi:hypothetical protein
MWLALRGVALDAVWAEFRRADLPLLLGLSIPAYLLMVYLRALRWRCPRWPVSSLSGSTWARPAAWLRPAG